MDDIELKIFIGMSRSLNSINKKTSRLCSEYGLTVPQFGVLEALYHKGALSIGEVQEKTLITSGTLPVIVRNLEKEGLVEKERDREDKRKYILEISNKGRELMDIVYPKNRDIIISSMEVWTDIEKDNLLDYFRKFGGIYHGEED